MKSQNPILSIVVTAYNLEEYIEDCIQSILMQKCSEIEVIIIDDGYTDASKDIYDKLASNPFVRIFSQENQGVSAARNRGLNTARGEYIYFVDGDDLLAPNSIESIIQKIQFYNSDIISGDYVKFINPNKIQSKKIVKQEDISAVESLSGHFALAELMSRSLFLPNVSTNIVKRSLFIENNISFEVGVSNNEDLNCGMQLYIVANSIAVLKDTIYYYRQSRTNSLSSRPSMKSVEGSIAFINYWIVELKKIESEDPAKALLIDYIAYQYLIAIGSAYSCYPVDRNLLVTQLAVNKWLFSSRLSKKTRYVGAFYDMFGINATGLLLSTMVKIKSLKRRSLASKTLQSLRIKSYVIK
jgi:glycosyltransferase involved in cell wall biosynthesis